ncbi:hypothetical protein [Deinococcus sp. Marseille-Q6407]|nr:hypothetical protein [Deinococcus sp. Marseille-Q6407]
MRDIAQARRLALDTLMADDPVMCRQTEALAEDEVAIGYWQGPRC